MSREHDRSPGLTSLQRAFLERFFGRSFLRDRFALAGGTALSGFYLRHRWSEDLDLFARDRSHELDLVRDVVPAIEQIAGELGLRARVAGAPTPGLVRIAMDGAGGEPHPLRRIDLVVPRRPPEDCREREAGIVVASLRDLAIDKLIAAGSRKEVKDAVDLYYLDRHPQVDLLALLEPAVSPRFGLSVLELADAMCSLGEFGDEWPSFARLFLAESLRFDELVRFGRRFARLVDEAYLPPGRGPRREP